MNTEQNMIIFAPLGYSRTFPQLANLTEVHGDASTFLLLFFGL
jgi:hypothetical protein